MRTDTERLDFLLQYFDVADIGSVDFVPGIICMAEELEQELSAGVLNEQMNTPMTREIIDRAIEANND